MEKWRTKGGDAGSRWNQRERRIIAHFILSPAEQRAHQLWHFHAARRARARASVSSTVGALRPLELLIVFLGPDRLSTLKYTQLTLAQNCRTAPAISFPPAPSSTPPHLLFFFFFFHPAVLFFFFPFLSVTKQLHFKLLSAPAGLCNNVVNT